MESKIYIELFVCLFWDLKVWCIMNKVYPGCIYYVYANVFIRKEINSCDTVFLCVDSNCTQSRTLFQRTHIYTVTL